MSRTSSRRRPSASRPKLVQTKLVQRKPVQTKRAQTNSFGLVTARQRELNTKRRGELAELEFVLQAASRGFGVARPYGDSERYDVILDSRDLTPPRNHPAKPVTTHVATAASAVSRSEASDRAPRPVSRQATDRNPRPAIACPALGRLRTAGTKSNCCPTDPSPPLWRVQVKCSTQLFEGFYRVNAHRRACGRAVPYLPGEIHFFAVYIIPEDTWYIIPLHATRGFTSLLFRRHSDRRPGLYDAYREAWHLLRPPG
jgi:hypothetical protein